MIIIQNILTLLDKVIYRKTKDQISELNNLLVIAQTQINELKKLLEETKIKQKDIESACKFILDTRKK